MGKFLVLLTKNTFKQIKEKPFSFFLICLSLSVGLFCSLFFIELIFQSNTDCELNLKNLQIEAVLTYLTCMIVTLCYTMINTVSLYNYINSENRKKYSIYKMFGCNNKALFFLSFCEFFFYTIISTIIGTLVFYATEKWRIEIGLLTFPQVYIGVLLFVLINILVIFVISYRLAKTIRIEKEQLWVDWF